MRPKVALGIWVGIPVMLIVLATLDALKPADIPGLPQAPIATLWALPLDLFLRDLAMALTLGFLLVGGLLVSSPSPRMLQLASLFAGAWWFLLVLQIPLTVSEVLALPLTGSLDPTIVASLLSQTTLGQVIVIQLALVGAVALLTWATRGRIPLVIVGLLAASAAFMPGFSGHSAMSGGHTSATVSLGLHLVTVGMWVGGVVALAALASVDPGKADLAIRRFSACALVCVVILAETGLLSASLRMDSLAELVTSQYGAIVLAKSLVLIILIGFGWKHRQVLRALAAGSAPPDSAAYFLRLIGFEVAWMSVAIGLAVTLSRTAPPGDVPGDVVVPGVLVLLGVALPVWAVVWLGERATRFTRSLPAYPEAIAVGALALTAVAALAMPGLGLLTLLGCVVITGAGWCAISIAARLRSITAIIILMVGWPLLIWWSLRGTPIESSSGTWAVVLLAEGLLVLVAMSIRSTRVTHTSPVVEDVPV
jgi:putative copper export protein